MVVTMNQPQRELVDTLVQNAEKDDPSSPHSASVIRTGSSRSR